MNSSTSLLIVNADDFGQSSTVNRAIMSCFRQGLISSTTIMANMPGFDEAVDMALSNGLQHNVGVHLNLTDGEPLLSAIRSNASLCDDSGRFRRFRKRLLSTSDRRMIASEVSAQIQKCHVAGLPLTHADSHQHVHNEPAVFQAIQPVLKDFGIQHLRISRNMDVMPQISPKRIAKVCFNHWLTLHGLRGTDYFGTVENFVNFRCGQRVTGASFEIMTHPSFDASGQLIDHTDNLPLADRLFTAFRGMHISAYRPSQLRAA
jgi:predicted glycoside hydrolase/deacetylase ChbG (UPF0249 family)